jgi:midasin
VAHAVQLNRSVCKMLLTLANLGIDLSTNGFCKPLEQEEGSDEGEGEGTGMGQGHGREDVTEEIENEGQMEGLQGEENKDPQVSCFGHAEKYVA